MKPLSESKQTTNFALITVTQAVAGPVAAWAHVGTSPIVIIRAEDAVETDERIIRAAKLLNRSPHLGLIWSDTKTPFLAIKAPYIFELQCFDEELEPPDYFKTVYERLLNSRLTNGMRVS